MQKNVIYIGRSRFGNCENLVAIYYLGTKYPSGSAQRFVFEDTCIDIVFVLPEYAGDTFCDMPVSTHTIQSDELIISGTGAMYGYSTNERSPWQDSSEMMKRDDVSLHSNIITIGERSFYNCPELTNISLPSNLATLGSYALSECASLQGMIIPASVDFIGERCFYRSSLNSVIFERLRNPSRGTSVLDSTGVRRVHVPAKYADSDFCGYSISRISTSIFSPSDVFTDSAIFLEPASTLAGITISQSVTFLVSFISVKSVTASISYVSSKKYSYMQLDNGEYSMVSTEAYVRKYFLTSFITCRQLTSRQESSLR